MSWSISKQGTPEEIKSAVKDYFEPLVKEGNDPLGEYASAKSSLLALIAPLPDIARYNLSAYGSLSIYEVGGVKKVLASGNITLSVA